MRARLQTLSGPRIIDIRDPRDATRAACALSRYDQWEIATNRAPPWSTARIKYIREGPRAIEDWRAASEVARRGGGDCEDLAAYRAADLRIRGFRAWPAAYRSGPGRIHVVVHAPPRMLDPSRAGGMEGDTMRYHVCGEGGHFVAQVSLPRAEPIWRGYGVDAGDALATALIAADEDLPTLWPGLSYPPGAELADTITDIVAGSEVGALPGALAALGPALGRLAAPALGRLASPALDRLAVPALSELAAPALGGLRQVLGRLFRRARARPRAEAPTPPMAPPPPTVLPPSPAMLPATVAPALALGHLAARAREELDPWRALQVIAEYLRREEPGGPFFRLVRALTTRSRR